MNKSPEITMSPRQAQTMVDGFKLEDDEIRQFTANEVIQSFHAGVQKGQSIAIELEQKAWFRQIRDNAGFAAMDTLKVIAFLKEIGISVLSAHLKIESRYSISVLITVSTSDYVKEVFTQVYNFVSALHAANTNELYSVDFQFINKSEHFDIDAVKNAGFTSSFTPLEK